MMLNYRKIKTKVTQSGYLGLFSAALRSAARIIDREPKHNHQLYAHKVLSRYTTFEGKEILEVGGNQSCESVYPFLNDGAAIAIVTGLNHISQEQPGKEHNLSIMRADALKLSDVFAPSRFDVVYGLSIVEHISSPKTFLDEVYTVLKPGGIAYFDGDPIWSSPNGHHLWVATWCGAYQNKATANYLWSGWPGKVSTNPLPDFSHLLMTPIEMRVYLTEKSIPSTDIDCIIDWVFYNDELNRINMSEIAKAYTRSKLIVLEANTTKVKVSVDVQAALRNRCGDGIDYSISGVSYVLTKPK